MMIQKLTPYHSRNSKYTIKRKQQKFPIRQTKKPIPLLCKKPLLQTKIHLSANQSAPLEEIPKTKGLQKFCGISLFLKNIKILRYNQKIKENQILPTVQTYWSHFHVLFIVSIDKIVGLNTTILEIKHQVNLWLSNNSNSTTFEM